MEKKKAKQIWQLFQNAKAPRQMHFPVTVKEFCVGRTKSYKEPLVWKPPTDIHKQSELATYPKNYKKNPTEEVKFKQLMNKKTGGGGL